ncbi:hypothetical protein H4582DRAFT_2052063 [Lactarius indigo]|nr:hypothetical protein H4582DRAFT_2052063 [Lactarius indigo]
MTESLPHELDLWHKQGTNQPGFEDFGFDTPPPELPPPIPSDVRADAALPRGEDFGFDDYLPLQSQESGMGVVPSSENDDFGMDVPVPPQALHSSTPISVAQLPSTGGDEDFGMDDPMPTDGSGGDEDFGMDVPLPSDPQGRCCDTHLILCMQYGFGASEPHHQEMPGRVQRGRILLNRNIEYQTRAAALRAEANSVQQRYMELRQVFSGDLELTDTVEEMAVELELGKYK